jgi:hypothetical protein
VVRSNLHWFCVVLVVQFLACSEAAKPKRPKDSLSSGGMPNAPADPTPSNDDTSADDDDTAEPDSNDDDEVPSSPNDVEQDAGVGGTSAGGASAGAGSTSGGAGGAPLPPLEPAEFGDYGVLCKDANGGQTTTPQFSLDLYIVNQSGSAVALADFTLRYFFTADNSMAEEHRVYIDYAGPDVGGASNITSLVSPLTPEEVNADSFVELGFGAAGCAGGCMLSSDEIPDLNARTIKLRVQIQPPALRYDLTNDYSFTPQASEPVACGNIVLYRRGEIVFGVQPDGATLAPASDGGVLN